MRLARSTQWARCSNWVELAGAADGSADDSKGMAKRVDNSTWYGDKKGFLPSVMLTNLSAARSKRWRKRASQYLMWCQQRHIADNDAEAAIALPSPLA